MDRQELDDLLDDDKAELEARFRELEREAELEELRRQTGGAPPDAAGAKEEPGRGSAAGDDPLADMKATLDSDAPLERYLLVICSGCGAKNRMSLTRVRTKNPICGHCKEDLARVRTQVTADK